MQGKTLFKNFVRTKGRGKGAKVVPSDEVLPPVVSQPIHHRYGTHFARATRRKKQKCPTENFQREERLLRVCVCLAGWGERGLA
jgi:hypothetical protein